MADREHDQTKISRTGVSHSFPSAPHTIISSAYLYVIVLVSKSQQYPNIPQTESDDDASTKSNNYHPLLHSLTQSNVTSPRTAIFPCAEQKPQRYSAKESPLHLRICSQRDLLARLQSADSRTYTPSPNRTGRIVITSQTLATLLEYAGGGVCSQDQLRHSIPHNSSETPIFRSASSSHPGCNPRLREAIAPASVPNRRAVVDPCPAQG